MDRGAGVDRGHHSRDKPFIKSPSDLKLATNIFDWLSQQTPALDWKKTVQKCRQQILHSVCTICQTKTFCDNGSYCNDACNEIMAAMPPVALCPIPGKAKDDHPQNEWRICVKVHIPSCQKFNGTYTARACFYIAYYFSKGEATEFIKMSNGCTKDQNWSWMWMTLKVNTPTNVGIGTDDFVHPVHLPRCDMDIRPSFLKLYGIQTPLYRNDQTRTLVLHLS